MQLHDTSHLMDPTLPDLELTVDPSFDSPLLSVPPHCLMELAAEIEEPEIIAKRWGLTEEKLQSLLANPALRLQLEAKRAELKTSGVSFRMKAEILAEEVMMEVYRAAKDPDASKIFKLEAAKWLTKIADREPKQNSVNAAGAGFSLQINIPATNSQQPTTIDVTPTTETLETSRTLTSETPESTEAYYLDLPDWLKTKAKDMATELGAEK